VFFTLCYLMLRRVLQLVVLSFRSNECKELTRPGLRSCPTLRSAHNMLDGLRPALVSAKISLSSPIEADVDPRCC
jgi:hypothetical protein